MCVRERDSSFVLIRNYSRLSHVLDTFSMDSRHRRELTMGRLGNETEQPRPNCFDYLGYDCATGTKSDRPTTKGARRRRRRRRARERESSSVRSRDAKSADVAATATATTAVPTTTSSSFRSSWWTLPLARVGAGNERHRLRTTDRPVPDRSV